MSEHKVGRENVSFLPAYDLKALFALVAVGLLVVSGIVAIASSEAEQTPVSNGSQIDLDTTDLKEDYFTGLGATCDSASYTYDGVDTGTLTIKNFSYDSATSFVINAKHNLIINVEGNNSLITSASNYTMYAITTNMNALTINGTSDDTLTVEIKGNASGGSSIIYATDITINGGVNVKLVNAGGTTSSYNGALGTGALTVSDGSTLTVDVENGKKIVCASFASVNIDGSTVALTIPNTTDATSKIGFSCTNDMSITNDSNVIVTVGNNTATSGASMTATYLEKGILTVKDSSFSSSAGDNGTYESYGVAVSDSKCILINSSELYVAGSTSAFNYEFALTNSEYGTIKASESVDDEPSDIIDAEEETTTITTDYKIVEASTEAPPVPPTPTPASSESTLAAIVCVVLVLALALIAFAVVLM